MSLMMVFVFGSCSEDKFIEDEFGPNGVKSVKLAENYKLTNVDIDSTTVTNKITFMDQGSGKLLLTYNDGTEGEKDIDVTQYAFLKLPSIGTIVRQSQEIKYLEQKVTAQDSTGLDRDKYSLQYDESLALDIVAGAHYFDTVFYKGTQSIKLPYFKFDSIRHHKVTYKSLPDTVLQGQKAKVFMATVAAQAFRSHLEQKQSQMAYIPVKEVIFSDPIIDDDLISMDEDKEKSAFTRKYERTESYVKYLDTWNWVINRRYKSKTEISKHSKTLTATLEVPARKVLYQSDTDFKCTKSWIENEGKLKQAFHFQCGNYLLTINEAHDKEVFEYGGKSLDLSYHYFKDITFNGAIPTTLKPVTVDGVTYNKVTLVKISLTAVNSNGEKEPIMVEVEVRDNDGGGQTPDNLVNLTGKDGKLYEEEGSKKTVSEITIEMDFGKYGKKDSIVSTYLDIFVKSSNIFVGVGKSKNINNSGITQTKKESSRKDGHVQITRQDFTYNSKFLDGYSHQMTGRNEIPTFVMGKFSVPMKSSSISMSFEDAEVPDQATEVTHDGKTFYRYTPTKLNYIWSYNGWKKAIVQEMHLDIEKGITPPETEKLTDLTAMDRSYYFNSSSNNWVSKLIAKMTFSQGSKTYSRDTTVTCPYDVTVQAQSIFNAFVDTKSLALTSITENASTSNAEQKDDFIITKRNKTYLCKYNQNIQHNLYVNDATIVFKLGNYQLDMLTGTVNINKNGEPVIPSSPSSTVTNNGKQYDRYTPTKLNYNWTYGVETNSVTQEMHLDVLKGAVPPETEEFKGWTNINKELKWDANQNKPVTIVTATQNFKKGNDTYTRDTTYKASLNVEVTAQSIFSGKVEKKEVRNQSVGNFSTNSSTTRKEGENIVITTNKQTATAAYEGFTHVLNATNETAKVVRGEYSIDMLDANITAAFKSSDIPATSSSSVTDNGITYDRYTPTNLVYEWTYSDHKAEVTQQMHLDVKKTELKDKDAWLEDQVIVNKSGQFYSEATLKIKNSNDEVRSEFKSCPIDIKIWGDAFSAFLATSNFSYNNFSGVTPNETTRSNGEFTIKRTITTMNANFNGENSTSFNHKLYLQNEVPTLVAAGKTLTMKGADLSVAYSNHTQDAGQVNGLITTYPTHINYNGSFDGHNIPTTVDGEIKVEKAMEPNLPDWAGPIDWNLTKAQCGWSLALNQGEVGKQFHTNVYTFATQNGKFLILADGSVIPYKNSDISATSGKYSATTTTDKSSLALAGLKPAQGTDYQNGGMWEKLTSEGMSTTFPVSAVITTGVKNLFFGTDNYSYNENTGVLTITLASGAKVVFKGK